MAAWESELDELMRARGGALVRYAYMLSGDRALAEDLVQDALVKVYSRLRRPGRGGAVGVAAGSRAHDLDSPFTNAEGYVRRAILTIYLDGYRKRQRWAGIKHLMADDPSTRGADQAASARVDVMAALARLGARERACVVLRYFEDMTVPQIAEALGTAQGTVKRYLSDATKNLQEILRPDDFRPAEGRAAR
ncbi:sigma-70 family RNA polymerase sigma factor [Promicromonospora thailandica]|uniref:RNA polymerase sigma-70 factor, ECF subfamily n=1 Tax=Promicromonospora thailandica TaxID=765201 RepID=A0A9X2G587_9MICO|nr:sigma-70 family RNA polymerase sigma factor [Promicromonospora thailandica]MCP2263514.1 RNA polymerase sigma-70 factor, ECF subfamily [Promicromonospora thailandica]